MRFEFSNDGRQCDFKQTVYAYNARGRNQKAALYQSEKSSALCGIAAPFFMENEPEIIDGIKTMLRQAFAADRQ